MLGRKRKPKALVFTPRRISETDVIVLQVLSTKDHLTTAFGIGCEAFPRIGRPHSVACTEWASRRLAKLRDHGLVGQPKRGFWLITDEGRRFLSEKEAA
jgi:hypothetical protein